MRKRKEESRKVELEKERRSKRSKRLEKQKKEIMNVELGKATKTMIAS